MKIIVFCLFFLFASNANASDCIKGGELAKKIIDNSIVFYSKKSGIIYKQDDSFFCLISKNSNYVDSPKIISKIDKNNSKASVDSIKSYEGLWIDNNFSQSNILIKSSSGNLIIEGGSEYTNSSGSTSVGEFSGSAKFVLKDDVIKVNSKKQNDCYLQFRLVGDLLVVLDSGEILGSCGGYGASFSGIYKKKSTL